MKRKNNRKAFTILFFFNVLLLFYLLMVGLLTARKIGDSNCIDVGEINYLVAELMTVSKNCLGKVETVRQGDLVHFTCVGWEEDVLNNLQKKMEQ